MGNNLICRRFCRRRRSSTAAFTIGECTYEEEKHPSTKFYVTVVTSNARTGENSVRITTHDRRDIVGLKALHERLWDLPGTIHGRDKALEYVFKHIQHCLANPTPRAVLEEEARIEQQTMRFW